MLTGGTATTSRGGRERKAAAQQEAKTKVKTEVQMATMMARLLVATTTSATQTNNQPTTGARECRGLFGWVQAEGRWQSHQRLRCLRSRDQQCNKSPSHQASANDRRWDDGPWCNRRHRCTLDGGTKNRDGRMRTMRPDKEIRGTTRSKDVSRQWVMARQKGIRGR
jgi:hypothetical protein